MWIIFQLVIHNRPMLSSEDGLVAQARCSCLVANHKASIFFRSPHLGSIAWAPQKIILPSRCCMPRKGVHGHNKLKEKGKLALTLICSGGDYYMCMTQHQLRWCGLDFPLWKATNYEEIQMVLTQVVADRTSPKALSYWPSLGLMQILWGYLI